MTLYRREKTVRGCPGAPTHNRPCSSPVYGTPKRSPGRAAASGFCWVGSEDSHARRASGDCQVQPTTHGRFNCLTRVSTTRSWSGAQEEARFGLHTGQRAAHMRGSGSFCRSREPVPATVAEAVGGWWRRHGSSCWHCGTLPGTASADRALPGADALRGRACSARAPCGCGRSCQSPAAAGPRELGL